MLSDCEGYVRPEINSETCNDCGACKRVCPVLHPQKLNQLDIPKIYACWNKNEKVRLLSSSGGIFNVLAEHVLDNGGIVFGAAFDENMRVKHISVSQKDELGELRGSKYVQSDIGCAYREVKSLLRQNRMVLFSGTPCQIAALYSFCGKDNDNLLTCDVICRGVPSPGLFAKYVDWLEKRFGSKLVSINVRDKRKGWHFNSTLAFFNDGYKRVLTGFDDSFMYGFNKLMFRPACYHCPYANPDRQGDITLGDFWGIGEIEPFCHSTRNGISLILVNSKRGHRLFEATSKLFYFEERALIEPKNFNPGLNNSPTIPINREQFFTDYQQLEYKNLAKIYFTDKGLKALIKRVVPPVWIFTIKKYIKKNMVRFRKS